MLGYKKSLFIILLILGINQKIYASTAAQITSFADIIEPLMPTVVNIYTVKFNNQPDKKDKALPESIPYEQLNNFFEQFNIPFSFDELYTSPNAMILGSGFIVDAKGYIVTNDHVIAGSDEIYVKLFNGKEVKASIVGTDPKTDIALLKIETKEKLVPVTFAESNKTRVGDIVIAIGNPLGFGGTVTTGIISSKGRDLGINQDDLVDDFIQTDAAINNGNSGGPLYDINGQVIGINTSIPDVGTGTNIGIGFAIPSDTVQGIMNQLKEKGEITRGRLDIAVQDITDDLADALLLAQTSGVLVVNVKTGGSGEKAGLKRGDLITEYNGKAVSNSRKLLLFVADSHIGDKINLTVLRDGKTLALTAEIAKNEPDAPKAKIEEKGSLKKSGIIFCDLSPNLITKYELGETNKGILVLDIIEKEPNIDLKIGDLIMTINKETIENTKQFDAIYEKIKSNKKQNVVLLVKRRDSNMFVALPIK